MVARAPLYRSRHASARAEPVTGRVYVAISRTNEPRRPPIEQTGEMGVPLFGMNVDALPAGR